MASYDHTSVDTDAATGAGRKSASYERIHSLRHPDVSISLTPEGAPCLLLSCYKADLTGRLLIQGFWTCIQLRHMNYLAWSRM